MRIYSKILLVVLALACPGCSRNGSAKAVFTPADLKGGEAKTYLMKMSDLPPSVFDAVKSGLSRGRFELADKGAPWNETDVVQNKTLPFRRLVWAAEIRGHFVVHYEMGGIGYSTHFLVLSPEDRSGRRTLVWAGAAFEIAEDFPAFFRLLAADKVNSDPHLIH